METRQVFSVKLSRQERQQLDALAERRAETRGNVLRTLIRRAAEQTTRPASTERTTALRT